MGNQLLKSYEADQSIEVEGGPYLKWKVLSYIINTDCIINTDNICIMMSYCIYYP